MTKKKEPEPMMAPTVPDPAPDPALCACKSPHTGNMVNVKRPLKGDKAEGEQFNKTVMDPATRQSWAHRFKVIGGVVTPVNE